MIIEKYARNFRVTTLFIQTVLPKTPKKTTVGIWDNAGLKAHFSRLAYSSSIDRSEGDVQDQRNKQNRSALACWFPWIGENQESGGCVAVDRLILIFVRSCLGSNTAKKKVTVCVDGFSITDTGIVGNIHSFGCNQNELLAPSRLVQTQRRERERCRRRGRRLRLLLRHQLLWLPAVLARPRRRRRTRR